MSSPATVHILPRKAEFLTKYKITTEEFNSSGLRWDDLKAIFADYSQWCTQLPHHAECLAAILRQCPEVHLAKSRAKKPENLIEKIIRKSAENATPWATISNYVQIVPDMIGVRALYLFQAQWPVVNKYIRASWQIKKVPKPVAYIQDPTPPSTRSSFLAGGCNVRVGKDGYQSVHYEMSHQVGPHKVRVEIQARTLYQEAWGEVSHVTAYPYRKHVALLVRSMVKLAEATMKADHFSSTIAGLSKLSDALERSQRPDPALVKSYNAMLEFLITHYPDASNDLAQASSAPSLQRLSTSLRVS